MSALALDCGSIVVPSFPDGKEISSQWVEVVPLMNLVKLHSIMLTHLVAFSSRVLFFLFLF